VKINILIATVSGGKETRFYNGTGHISELAVSTSKYHVCLMSHDKIPLNLIIFYLLFYSIVPNYKTFWLSIFIAFAMHIGICYV